MSLQRRDFLVITAAATNTALLSPAARAQEDRMLDEKSSPAQAVGYVALAKNADKKKYPSFAPSQNCANCSLFDGKATDAAGGCPLFEDKQVSSQGWCSAWDKKG